MSTNYPPGTPLEVRSERWTLAREQRFGMCRLLTLGGADPENVTQTLRVIEPFDRPRQVTRQRVHRRPRRAVLRAALAAIASARSADGLWSAAAAAITIWPYQLEPALSVISGATRLLLADDVGLGKTIQAGLILSELRARGWIERALIVCPCGLRDTWAHELRDRFGLAAAIVDQRALADRIATLPPGINPWSGEPIVIVSIDLLKRPEVLAAVERVPIDLLIADEAHHLTPGTDRGSAVSRVATRVPWVALLSATPHSGDAAAFSYLSNVGSHGDALTVFRRTRREIGIEPSRRSHLLPVHPVGSERDLLVAVDRYVRAIWHGRGLNDHAVRLLVIIIARRAASSPEALTRTLTRRLALLSGDAIREPEQGLLPWDETESTDDTDADGALAVRGLDDSTAERRTLEQLLDLTRACGVGSKTSRLLRIIRAVDEPVLVFTEYRDTLNAIASRLGGTPHAVMHGGVPADARRDAATQFNDGRVSILLATDAAGEGLNLHHRCRLVIDMELPWNPLRLEQRVGRVDRIGQGRTVHAIRLFHPGTIESRVLDHLGIRHRRAHQAMDRYATERDIAHAVFDDRELPVRPTLPASDSVSAAGRQAERIMRQRAWCEGGSASAIRCWTSARSGPMLTVHRTTRINSVGLPTADLIAARVIAFARRPANRREWRRLVERLAQQPPAMSVSGDSVPTRARLEARVAAIRAMLASRAQIEYQRSLFDARADSEAEVRDRTTSHLDAALGRILMATSVVDVGAHSELIAAWPGHRR